MLKKTGDTGDKRTWHIGGKEVNKGQDAERYKGFGRRKGKEVGDDELIGEVESAPSVFNGPTSAADDLMSSLAGLDLSTPTLVAGDAPLLPSSSPSPRPTIHLPPTSTSASKAVTSTSSPTGRKMSTPLTHGADKWLSRLLLSPEGILYEDGQLQIGVKCEFHGHLGRIAIFFGNKISVALESFTATIDVEDPDALTVTLPKIPTSTLGPMSQIQQLVHVECKDIFHSPPILNISYLAGSLQTITLRLPIFLSKFVEPVQLGAADFFERWKQIGGPPREAQNIFPIKLRPEGGVDVAKNQKVVSGTGFGLLDGIDPNPNNIVAAGVLHMSTAGKVGCLLRLEPNTEAKVSSSLVDLGWDMVADSLSSRPAVSVDDSEHERGRVGGHSEDVGGSGCDEVRRERTWPCCSPFPLQPYPLRLAKEKAVLFTLQRGALWPQERFESLVDTPCRSPSSRDCFQNDSRPSSFPGRHPQAPPLPLPHSGLLSAHNLVKFPPAPSSLPLPLHLSLPDKDGN